jgi:glycosyltransferase involved in cell wall biosynthesis
MRVVLVPYPGTFGLVGGHVTQQVETANALRRLGVDASIVPVEDALDADADVVHAFGDIQPLLARGRPKGMLVASPVYNPKSVVLGPVRSRGGARHILEARLRHAARRVRYAGERRGRERDVRASLDAWRSADLVVVNSHAEGRLLERDAGAFPRLRVAYSGVAEGAFGGDAAIGRELLGIGDEPFVLTVARVERLKNQVSLALALRGMPVRLVLVGAVLPGNEHVLAAVRTILPNVLHVGHVDHDDVRHVHAAAALHALPSWYETTGLSTLEAFAAGRPAVAGSGPCVREYFGDCATFCDPRSIRSIRSAVLRALDGPRGCELDCARSFSWDRTARELVAAYEEALDAG